MFCCGRLAPRYLLLYTRYTPLGRASLAVHRAMTKRYRRRVVGTLLYLLLLFCSCLCVLLRTLAQGQATYVKRKFEELSSTTKRLNCGVIIYFLLLRSAKHVGTWYVGQWTGQESGISLQPKQASSFLAGQEYKQYPCWYGWYVPYIRPSKYEYTTVVVAV